MTVLKNALGKDVIEVGQQFYIRASSSLADDRTRVLLHGDTFAVFDRGGIFSRSASVSRGSFTRKLATSRDWRRTFAESGHCCSAPRFAKTIF